ncbi:MAG: hypothetical protein IRZ07_04135 [Microbispora sp.]|nr:hypothetical protein [Microbispora sp.]
MASGGQEIASHEVLERLTRIEVKLDAAISRADDHESRLRRLERAVWVATGAAAIAGGAIGEVLRQALGG